MQEELGWTRSSLRKCIRPLVENCLRAHDDDPRVPVLVNRRAVMKDPCFNAGSRARHLTVCGSRLPFPTRIAKIHALNNRTRRAEPAGSAREDRELLTLELAVQHACDPQQSSSKQSESAGFRHNFDVAVSAGKHDRAVRKSFAGIDRQLHGHTVGVTPCSEPVTTPVKV